MANTDAPRGAWPLRHLTGGVIRAEKEFAIASAYGTAIYKGDFVSLVAAGGIEVGATGARLLGVFMGCRFTDTDGSYKIQDSWPASQVASDAVASVIADPNVVFGIQSAGSTVEADRGQLGDIIATAGDAATRQSRMEISGTTATGTAQLKVLDKIDRPDNDWGTNVDLEVIIFEHEFNYHGQTNPGV